MLKKVLLIIFLLFFSLSLTTKADTITSHSVYTSPKTLDIYYENTFSNKAFIDLPTKLIKNNYKISYIKLNDFNIFSELGDYGELIIYVFDNKGNKTRLIPQKANYDFQGKKLNNELYIKFYTPYLEFEGNLLRIGRPLLSIGLKKQN